jgi:phasin family protein
MSTTSKASSNQPFGNGTNFAHAGQEAMKQFQNFKVPGVDSEQLSENYRRNMEFFTETQKIVSETARNIAELQTEFARQCMDDCSNYFRDIAATGANTGDKIDLHSSSVKSGVERVLSHSDKLGKAIQASNDKVSHMMHNRFKEVVDETKKMAKSAAKR